MKTLDRYLLKQFVPVFLAGMLFFILLLEMIDLFANLVRYLTNGAGPAEIAKVALFYLPKCVSYALPISLLFAAAYVLGDLYARNELTVFFSSGIPLFRAAVPFLAAGFLLSAASFFFEDAVVIPALKSKKALTSTLLRQERSASESDVVLKSDGGKTVYSVSFYNDSDRSLNGVSIVERDGEGNFLSLMTARRATWNGSSWDFEDPVLFAWEEGTLRDVAYAETGRYVESPDSFRRRSVDVEELRFAEAGAFVQDLKASGLPYAGALADHQKRLAFSATSLVVVLLSIAAGGRFKKNVLLASLLSGLVASVVYYVVQMVSMMLAKLGYVDPVAGAWAPVAVFTALGAYLVSRART